MARRHRSLDDDTKKKIATEVQHGRPLDQIMAEYGISHSELTKILEERGVMIKPTKAKRKKRNIIKFSYNYYMIELGKWLYRNPEGHYTLDELIRAVGLDTENRHDRTKIYYVLYHWRTEAREHWDRAIEEGTITPGNFAKTWWNFVEYINKNYKAFFLLFDRNVQAYYQPRFHEKEVLDQRRLEHKIFSLTTVLKEMCDFDEHLLLTDQPIRKALNEADDYMHKYITDSAYADGSEE